MPQDWTAPSHHVHNPNHASHSSGFQPAWRQLQQQHQQHQQQQHQQQQQQQQQQRIPRVHFAPHPPADVTNWNMPPAGTPFPWLAHPLPHPHIPAQQFWNHAPASMHPSVPWMGPYGLQVPPGAAGALGPNTAYVVTGGHPLPGQDATWTPGAAWVPMPALVGQSGAAGQPANAAHYRHDIVLLAPYLVANPRNGLTPHILWDTAIDPPSAIKRLTGRGDIVDFAGTPAFDEQATYPAVEELHVEIPMMRPSWGSVKVKKKANRPWVEVCDVYEAIHKFLRKRLTQDDVDSIRYSSDGGGEERYRQLEYECLRRCTNSHSLPEYQRRQGFRRVDLLGGLTVFWGMWPCYTPDGRWYLSMSFCPSTNK